MLQVSQRAHYGLRAMTELAKAYGRGRMSLAEIAEAEHLSAGYLEQLVAPLRKAGLVDGARGAHGGYELSSPPAQVTVGAVMRALEGPVAPVECLGLDYVAGSCERESVCLSQSVWRRVKQSVDGVLDSITLADLCLPGVGNQISKMIPVVRPTVRNDALSIDPCSPVDPCSIFG